MRRFGSLYLRALEANPLATKACTSGVTFSLVDLLAQTRERVTSAQPEPISPARMARGGLFGLLFVGPVNHVAWGARFGLECAARHA